MRSANNRKLNNLTETQNAFNSFRNLIKAITVFYFMFPLAFTTSAVEFNQTLERGTVIGKVFNDTNNNGIQDTNEYGIPGVRLATVTGLFIETDGYGRYHIPDSYLNSYINNSHARNFILKIDTASLPIGSLIQSENPRVIRLSKGSINKMNFAITY